MHSVAETPWRLTVPTSERSDSDADDGRLTEVSAWSRPPRIAVAVHRVQHVSAECRSSPMQRDHS